jgi:predicted SAM-dependent methyltransferase
MRLNLGCGHEPLEGYVNLDSYAVEADVQGDLRLLDFEDVTEVLMSHVLEHISWRETQDVLNRVHGWMRPGGLLRVEVPDMNLISREAMRNPDWLRYLYGSQEHDGETHRTGFTLTSLTKHITAAGFEILESHLFRSDNEHRYGMPVIQVLAAA